MDDQLIQEILSQKTKPSQKSVIYQRKFFKKEFTDEAQGKNNKSTKSVNRVNNLPLMDNEYVEELQSQKSKQSKVIQNTLNSLRRARLVSSSGQSKLNPENLERLNTIGSQKVEITLKEPKSTILEMDQNLEDEVQPIEAPKADASSYCVVCDQQLNNQELKLSERLQWYTKERGETRKFITRLRLRLKLKEESGQKENIINDDDGSLPLVCFKCQYDLILGNEGRDKAMRFYNLAHNELITNPNFPQESQKTIIFSQSRDPYLQPIKNTRMHQISTEMKDLGLMSGNATFYDYRRSVPSIAETQPVNLQNLDKTHHKKKPVNHSVMISIAREGTDALLTKSPYQDCQTNQTLQSGTDKVLRPWRQDFADKINSKYGSVPTQERQTKILRKIEKDRKKYLTGQRLQMLNQKILKEAQDRIKNPSSNMENGSQITGQILLKGSNQSQQKTGSLNRSYLVSTTKEFFTPDIHQKLKAEGGVDRTFFRRISNLGAYANASFNGGVFVNPAATVI